MTVQIDENKALSDFWYKLLHFVSVGLHACFGHDNNFKGKLSSGKN